MRDFNTWMNQTGKKLEISEGSTKRAGVRSHAYPSAYSRGQYIGNDGSNASYLTPHAADAAFYLTNSDAKPKCPSHS